MTILYYYLHILCFCLQEPGFIDLKVKRSIVMQYTVRQIEQLSTSSQLSVRSGARTKHRLCKCKDKETGLEHTQ